MDFFSSLRDYKDVTSATEFLFTLTGKTPDIERGLQCAIQAHQGQYRKSGEDYVTHPILVASVVAYFGGDEGMVIAALLHDVAEDTKITIEEIRGDFGDDIFNLVDGLTKIDSIRDEKLIPSNSNEKLIASAMTFRKMLVASIQDIRVLVIKLCDRLHNMLTLDALPEKKQKRISEETLVVYAPIAHRLGISSIKNELENLSFYYIFPHEYQKIHVYLRENMQEIQLKLNQFTAKVAELLMQHGFPQSNFQVSSRIKRPYSIYLKMQRKGISIDEVLDLLAVRILVNEPIDCYKVLGLIHLNFKPIISRFKDYITIPKENGYQTMHTTVFDKSVIYEVQIRTHEMHHGAEYGVAAHWKYKTGVKGPNLSWLNNLQLKNDNPEEFLELIKHDLYSEDISVFSPDGDVYTLPQGAVALDFAYAVHTEIGNCAKGAFVNKLKASLLTVLKNGDIIRIVTASDPIPRCSWKDAVKTSRAKEHIHQLCAHRMKEIDRQTAINVLATILDKRVHEINKLTDSFKLKGSVYKAARDLNYLRELKNRMKNHYRANAGLLTKIKIKILKLKPYEFENMIVHSNFSIAEVSFDYCCHPKRGDQIVAFKHNNHAYVHHKMCDHAVEQIFQGRPMLFVEWAKDNMTKYKVVSSLDNRKGALAQFLQFLSNNDINVVSIELGKQSEKYTKFCVLHLESSIREIKDLRALITKRYKIVDIHYEEDAYN